MQVADSRGCLVGNKKIRQAVYLHTKFIVLMTQITICNSVNYDNEQC